MYIWNYLKSNPLFSITFPLSLTNININFGDINIFPKHYNYSPKKVVSINNLKLRKKANNNSEIICTLNKNIDKVNIIIEKGNWCKVEVLNSSNYKGWVKKNGLSQFYLN
ncbi:SH3 domain-containing protein [Halanaerobium saccharolyticum]|uniref:SH3 domain-containing protein n=1 Tax=Halanaerobium saccharolyticum TaxID=43595 RepID=UPI0014170B6A